MSPASGMRSPATQDAAVVNQRPLAIVTGTSSGIGYQLARQCAENGFDLLIAADEPAIVAAVCDRRSHYHKGTTLTEL